MRRSIIAFEERPNTRERNRQRASVHSCLGGGNPSDIRHLFVVDSLDKHMQNEKELICLRLRRFLPAARTTRTRTRQQKGGYFVFVWGAGT